MSKDDAQTPTTETTDCILGRCLSRFRHEDECGHLGGCGAKYMLREVGKRGEATFPESDRGGTNRFVEAMIGSGWLQRRPGGQTVVAITEAGRKAALS